MKTQLGGPYENLKEDHPQLVASYLIAHNCSRRKKGSRDVNLSWGKKTLQDYNRAIRRITRLYDSYLDENNDAYSVRRSVINKGKRKRKPFREKPRYKYGVKIPQNVKEALEFDKENGNNKWAEAMKLEIQSLNNLECFEFQPKDYSPAKEYQKTTLLMIMHVKQDLRHKCRLVRTRVNL